VPYYNVKSFKNWNFLEFWAIDRTWPTLDKFYYFHFPKWKIDILNIYKKQHIWHHKNEGNLRQVIGKVKKKVNFESLRMSPSKKVPQTCFDPKRKATIFVWVTKCILSFPPNNKFIIFLTFHVSLFIWNNRYYFIDVCVSIFQLTMLTSI
jgi:hypothetical protein